MAEQVQKRHFYNQTRLYERIYHTLERLVPALRKFDAPVVGDIDSALRLRIDLLENHRFTTVVNLTFMLPTTDLVPDPCMTVRIYHDAQVAEVIGFQNSARFLPDYPYPNPWMHQRDEKRQVNQLLQEWLDYCLRRGPVFDETAAQPAV